MCTQTYLGPFEVECVMRKEYPGNPKRFKNFISTAPTLESYPQDNYFAFHLSHRLHFRCFTNLMSAAALLKSGEKVGKREELRGIGNGEQVLCSDEMKQKMESQ